MQLEVKTILNRIQHFAGFVYREVRFGYSARGRLRIHVCLQPHRSSRGSCSACRRPAPGYDRLPQRSWLFVPLWGIKTYFFYAPRRVDCPAHGVVVEHIPWSDGKRPVTLTMMCFLSRWARRLSWRETARAFRPSSILVTHALWRWRSVLSNTSTFSASALLNRRRSGSTCSQTPHRLCRRL